MNHRGRFQAQGQSLEESEPWSQDIALLHTDGVKLLDNLQKKIPRKESLLRVLAFKQCRKCIDDASKNNGINVNNMQKPFIKSFPKNHKERVDLEVRKGIAFILAPEKKDGEQ
ncbi:hypothetical protein [Flavobacterium collinsii]|uniref:Uncharacterized protein n=1 Tax=Flavobacterium collinsii TaxID=1114861 RepID=A0A9W4XAU8_9FLAO|nr:hypothetical protein [Flavobacterium collinsii]CAI2768163.1 conserved protein of unknown function [Flavobacterium collinsii]